MKAFLIYVKDHLESTAQAEKALLSCKDTGFDVELVEGITPLTVDVYNELSHCPGSRASHFFKQSEIKYKTKKSCFMNNVKIWEKCIELNEPVVFLEHDIGCVRNYTEEDFEDVLILNIESAMKQKVFNHIKYKRKWKTGIHEYEYPPLAYRHNVSQWAGSYIMPGNGAYAITPKAAKKLLDSAYTYGWEQGDHFINTANVTIQYIVPEYFTFKSENLNMSHGWENEEN